MNLQSIVLSEVSQAEKNKYHMIPLRRGIEKNTTNEQDTKQSQTYR